MDNELKIGGNKLILENKLHIINPAELAREEEKISKKKAKELFETGYLNSLVPGTNATINL